MMGYGSLYSTSATYSQKLFLTSLRTPYEENLLVNLHIIVENINLYLV